MIFPRSRYSFLLANLNFSCFVRHCASPRIYDVHVVCFKINFTNLISHNIWYRNIILMQINRTICSKNITFLCLLDNATCLCNFVTSLDHIYISLYISCYKSLIQALHLFKLLNNSMYDGLREVEKCAGGVLQLSPHSTPRKTGYI